MITEQQVEDALNFLSMTDQECAQLRRAVEAHEWLADKETSLNFLATDGTDVTVAERNHIAKTSQSVQQQKDKWLDALQAFHELENKRQTARLRIGCWQSLVKARSQ